MKHLNRILCITPINHIDGLEIKLKDVGVLKIIDDPSEDEFKKLVSDFEIIFTNPNKSKIFLGADNLKSAENLKAICTASTGTNHIDKEFCNLRNIEVISLTNELNVISTISSTAEHALTLMLSSIRNIKLASASVDAGNWDYEPFVGRQLDQLSLGIIGYGRLGKMMGKFCKALFKEVIIYDPYEKVDDKDLAQVVNIQEIAQKCDVVSLHVHVSNETQNLINEVFLRNAKPNMLLINTSRGEIVDEAEMVKFLKKNPQSKIATDVLNNEIIARNESPILGYSAISEQVLITPHIGGMTSDAQKIAYSHAASLLANYLNLKQKTNKV
jgi:phosphoglycerate dehydrogenase-like enzyme